MSDSAVANRSLIVNGTDLADFPSNYISTTKYNMWSFLPLSLFLQFRRIANIYFLVTAVLQSIPQISPLQPFSAIAPLVFVLSVSMIREGIEDYMRYRSDQEINSTKTHVYKAGSFEEVTFKDIKVGHLILINKDEVFPCDLAMLSNSNDNGMAYIETSTLDGEKNLKPRTALADTLEVVQKGRIIRLFAQLECEPPNPRIYQYNGKIHLPHKTASLDKNQLLLAGAFLRNTSWAIGVAIYTGNDTKLRQNLMSRRYKQSHIEERVNIYIVYIIALQAVLCLVAAFAGGAWNSLHYDDHWYLGEAEYSAGLAGFLNYFTYFLLINTMLPISLIITLEVVKMLQGLCMQRDEELYSKVRERACKVSSFSLNEELGQIQHIFTDKTGTLTSNRMEFKFCTIGNLTYGAKEPFRGTLGRRPTYVDQIVQFTFDPEPLKRDLFESPESDFYPLELGGQLKAANQSELNTLFLRCLSLCHECMAEINDGNIKYIGQSPDEITLVDSARWIGFTFLKIRSNIIDLEVSTPGGKVIQRFQRLCLFEFDSDRKRNSVIVTDLQTGRHFMFVKGADNIIMARLSASNRPDMVKLIDRQVRRCSNRGLRTLMMAVREFSESEFESISAEFKEISCAIDNREGKLSAFASQLQKDLFLIGCTAVEDALQADVPATISAFMDAGVNVWMLTGDKMETAANIGKTCSLIEDGMLVCKIKGPNIQVCHSKLAKAADKFKAKRGDAALIIDGPSLEFVLFDERDLEAAAKYPEISGDQDNLRLAGEIRSLFFDLTTQCKTIICCRATPGQKQGVVKAVKERTGCITLAIGDGANDVSMILEAHIGIGLYGEEGMQAVQSSDYAIGEFKYLWELMFVHGRYNYIRQSDMIMYFFYKNLVFTIPQFLFMFYCAFSGQTVYDDWYITCYNMVFTALPLLFRALFDIDVVIPKRGDVTNNMYFIPVQSMGDKAAQMRKLVPRVYEIGRKNQLFTPGRFMLWMADGFLHSVLVFFIPFAAANEGVMGSSGRNHGLWTFSITSFSCVILVVNIKLALCIRNWNMWHHLSILLSSVLLYFAFIAFYDVVTASPALLAMKEVGASYYFYFCMWLLFTLVVVVDGAVHILRRIFWPSSSELLMDYSLNTSGKRWNSCVLRAKGDKGVRPRDDIED